MRKTLLAQRLVALAAAGWLLLDFPLLQLALGEDARLFGLPRLPVLLFVLWGAGIAALVWLMEDRGDGADDDRADDDRAAPAPDGRAGPR